MTLVEVLKQAESKANAAIETVRQKIVLRVQGATSFTGVHGSSLRSQIESSVDSSLQNEAGQYHSDLMDAWKAGITRAENGKEQTHSTLVPDTSTFSEAIESGFDRLRAGINEDVKRLLVRASLNTDWTKERIIDDIGSSEESGMFSEFASRARGIVHYALESIESHAFSERARELAKIGAQKTSGAEAAKMLKEGIEPLTMKVWDHSAGGNPPRANHEAMDGKGVPIDKKFKLKGRDGETYWCEGPHDITLDIGEVANCHCTEHTVTINVTQEQKKFIYDEAAKTGGFRDSRWS